MTLYAGTILLTELLMLGMVIHVAGYGGFNRVQKRWYLLTFCSIMICAGAEFAAIHFNGRGAAFSLPLTVITVLQFSLTPLLPVFFVGALGLHSEARKAGSFFAIHVIVQLVSAPFGWIFYFDEVASYFHGQYYFVYELFYILSMIFMIVCLVIVSRRFRNRDRGTIIMILTVLLGAVAPLLLFHVYTNFIGVGMAACLCYIYYNDLTQQTVQREASLNQQRITAMQEHVISSLANLIENRDDDTGGHTARTGKYAGMLAAFAKQDRVYTDELDADFVARMEGLAPMHDIGKIVVSDRILRKPGKLTDAEFEEMKQHTTAGGKIVREILNGIADESYISFAADIAMYHHERWDGQGYPEGRKGEEIPLPARIMAIVDVFDALVSRRCYKEAMPVDTATVKIWEESGTHFDPFLTEVFWKHREEFEKVAVSDSSTAAVMK